MKKILFFILSVALFACDGTETQQQQGLLSTVKEPTVDKEIKKFAPPSIKYEDLKEEEKGGELDVRINHKRFLDKEYIFNTLRAKNIISYDEDTKILMIMARSYHNPNTNMLIEAHGINVKGKRRGKYAINTHIRPFAKVAYFYVNGFIKTGGRIKSGILTIEDFNEAQGYIKGYVEGEVKGVAFKSSFELFSSNEWK